MVLPVMTFTDPRLSQPIRQAPWLTGIQTGMGLAGQLQKMQQQAATAPIQRQLMQAQAQQALAHAQQLQASAKSPFGGKILPGAAGRSQGMKILSDTLGADSPYVQRAWKDYQADMELKIGRAQYFTANTILKNVPLVNKMQIMENYQNEQATRKQHRLLPQTFKEWYQRPENQAQPSGNVPSNLTPSAQGGAVPVTSTTPTAPEQAIAGTQQAPSAAPSPSAQVPPALRPAIQPQATAQAGLAPEPFGLEARQTGVGITTKTVPTFVLQKMAFANNIRKTYARMPEQAITAYSENPAKLLNDYKLSLQGKITPDYANFIRFTTNAKILATQARQFYGDTIQPAMLKRLDDMTNPISWRKSPKAALIEYHAVKNTLFREMDTYTDEASDPKFVEKARESKVLRGLTPHGTIPIPAQKKVADNDPLGIRGFIGK